MAFTLESLPIYNKLTEIHAFIKNNTSGAIVGPPGIGKSLGIPAYIASLTKDMKIYIAVPSINVARSLKMSQNQMSPQVNTSYAAVDFPPDERSQIVYATSEYIKNMFLNNIENGVPKGIGISVLLIDEAHLTSFDNFIIVNSWKFYQRMNAKHPRMYLLSATINEELYPDFPREKQLILSIVSKNVDIKYTSTEYGINRRDNNRKYIEMINRIIIHHQSLETLDGVFIVFLPGKGDVVKFNQMLKNVTVERKIDNIELIMAHSGLSREEFNKIYKSSLGRKIIIATNVVESAITIKSVVAIFDSMLEKRPSSEETFRLLTTFVSKASANQRAGRTGRNLPGICFRMCTKEQYDRFEEFRPAEIETAPIYRIVLKMLSINLLPWEILPKKYGMVKRIQDAILFMKDLTIIDNKNQISDLGNFYLEFDLSIRVACVLWWWLKSNTTNHYSGLIVALLINNYQDTYLSFDTEEIRAMGSDSIPFSERRELYKAKYFDKFRGNSDLHTYMNMWLSIFPVLIVKSINDVDILREWAESNKVDEKKITFFYKTLKNIMVKLNQKGFETVPLPYDTNETIYQIIPILRKIYSDKEFALIGNRYIRGNDRFILSEDYQVNNYDKLQPKKLLSFYEVSMENGVTKITFSVNIDLNDTRMFTLDVISSSGLKIRIPKRAHRPDFVSKVTITNINYPPVDWNKLTFGLNLEPEIPEQSIIEVGKIFPYQ